MPLCPVCVERLGKHAGPATLGCGECGRDGARSARVKNWVASALFSCVRVRALAPAVRHPLPSRLICLERAGRVGWRRERSCVREVAPCAHARSPLHTTRTARSRPIIQHHSRAFFFSYLAPAGVLPGVPGSISRGAAHQPRPRGSGHPGRRVRASAWGRPRHPNRLGGRDGWVGGRGRGPRRRHRRCPLGGRAPGGRVRARRVGGSGVTRGTRRTRGATWGQPHHHHRSHERAAWRAAWERPHSHRLELRRL